MPYRRGSRHTLQPTQLLDILSDHTPDQVPHPRIPRMPLTQQGVKVILQFSAWQRHDRLLGYGHCLLQGFSPHTPIIVQPYPDPRPITLSYTLARPLPSHHTQRATPRGLVGRWGACCRAFSPGGPQPASARLQGLPMLDKKQGRAILRACTKIHSLGKPSRAC